MLNRSTVRLVAAALMCLGAGAVQQAARAAAPLPLAEGESPGNDRIPKCVHVRSEARYSGLGYDHHVEIENGCDKAVSCVVTTDVNSDRAGVDVPAGQTRTVTTFRGSPAREFKADVACKSQP